MIPAVFVALLLLGLPIALVLAVTAIAYIFTSGNTVLLASYPQQMFGGIESYGLLAIPLFMLVGEVMHEGGVTLRLMGAAKALVGTLRGGLLYVNLLANMMVASILGSSAAQIALMTHVMVPEMERNGYRRDHSAATTAAAGLLSPIIPPSMVFVIYGVLAQISIGDMFIAGIIPGLMMALGFLLVIFVLGLFNPYPRCEAVPPRQRLGMIAAGLPAGLVPLVIVGSILTGLATPTESAAVATLGAWLVGQFVYREFRFRRWGTVLHRAAINSAIILLLIATAQLFGWVIVFEQVPQMVATWLQTIAESPFTFLLLMVALLVMLGCAIDAIAALIIVVPILLPIATDVYGIDPYQFGVVVCMTLVLGLLTPPVGAGLFIAASLSGVRPGQIFTAIWPFLLSTVVVVLLLCTDERFVTLLLG
ncbi:TRAP transporter large permease [Arhodomonas sp. SL1]|uniref:TRAP transporter large permease n=1 Tax=Arhodomonas sp. SL1 TaxID=3425691 RepID=UPI003F880F08